MKRNSRRFAMLLSLLLMLMLIPGVAMADEVTTADAFTLAVSNKMSAITISADITTTGNLTIDAGTSVTVNPGCTWTIGGGTVTVFGSVSGSVSGTYARYIPVSTLGNWSGGITGIAYIGFTNQSSTRDIVVRNGVSYVPSSYSGCSINVIETASGSVYKLSSGGTLSKVHEITYVDPETGNAITSLSPSEFIEADGAALPSGAPYVKTGYTFLGWSLNSASLVADISSVAAGTASDQTVYAIWQQDAVSGGAGAMAGGAGSFSGSVSVGGGSGAGGSNTSEDTDDGEDEDTTATPTPTATTQVRLSRANSTTKVVFTNGSAPGKDMPTAASEKKSGLSPWVIALVSLIVLGGVAFGIYRSKKTADADDDDDDDLE